MATIGPFSCIHIKGDKGHIAVGNEVYVGERTSLMAVHGYIFIGHNTQIGNNVSIVASNHSIAKGIPIASQPHDENGVTIGNDVWIGSGAVFGFVNQSAMSDHVIDLRYRCVTVHGSSCASNSLLAQSFAVQSDSSSITDNASKASCRKSLCL